MARERKLASVAKGRHHTKLSSHVGAISNWFLSGKAEFFLKIWLICLYNRSVQNVKFDVLESKLLIINYTTAVNFGEENKYDIPYQRENLQLNIQGR